jgi:hypothetical protein
VKTRTRDFGALLAAVVMLTAGLLAVGHARAGWFNTVRSLGSKLAFLAGLPSHYPSCLSSFTLGEANSIDVVIPRLPDASLNPRNHLTPV